MSSTSAIGSISTSMPLATPRPGKARSMVRDLVSGSHEPPRYPMTSLVHRCAWRSMTNMAAGETVSLKGCAPGTPDPGGEGENLRMGWSSRVPPPASLNVVAPTAAVSRLGLLRAYSVGSAAAASAAARSLASLTLASCLASFSAAFSAAFCSLSASLASLSASLSDRLRSISSSHARRSSVF